MADSFAVHIGGGTYLDADGKIVFGAPTGAQIYEAPGGFRLDTKKVQDAFKDLSGMLPADDDAKKKWQEWGVPAAVVDFLGKIAGVASIVATAISVYVWAIGVLIKIMDLMTGDEGMSPELAKTLYDIKNQLRGFEQIDRADKMIAMHSQFNGRVNQMHGLLTQLAIEKSSGAGRAGIFGQMRAIVDELAVPLSDVCDQEWAVTYDADAYKGRGFASGLLVFERSDGSTPVVPMAPPTVTHFDYRLGVPMLLYAATTYAALAQVAMPWFRSAGFYAAQLRETADAIDRFVIRMQDESLARTQYVPETVLQQRSWSVFEVPMGGGPKGWDPYPTYAVGAFDLVRYDDSFLWERFGAEFQAGADTGPRGLFNYHWYTPLQDLDEVAVAANEQAKQDYANLQVATGMFRLVSTAAWLRFLSTPPDRSQTVSGWASDTRSYVDESATTAKSPSIFPVGVIESPATLKRYNARSRVRITTQEPGYVPAFRYRIVLRTLRSQTGQEGWHNQDYVGDVWRADYEKTAADPRLNRLRTEFHENSVLSEIVLYENPSSTELVQRTGERTIQASTFDWYVPIVSPWGRYAETSTYAEVAKLAGSGGKKTMAAPGSVSIHLMGMDPLSPPAASEVTRDGVRSQSLELTRREVPPEMHVMGGAGPLAAYTDDLSDIGEVFALPDVSLDKAERRHVRTEEVSLSWQLDWKAEQLEIRLFGKPGNRAFQVYVVIEETVYSGEKISDNIADPFNNQQLLEQIHTPFVAEMVNQLVLVPESFFDEERKAIVQGAKMWHEFIRRFAESRPIGPGDPIEFLDRSIRAMAVRSQSTSTLAATIDERVEFARREAPELWEAVLREAQRETASS
jgi:hypothetical protein